MKRHRQCSPEALLAGHNDLLVPRDLLLNVTVKITVGNHVGAALPPATHAKGCCLLEKGDGTGALIHHKQRNCYCALDCCLVRRDIMYKQRRP